MQQLLFPTPVPTHGRRPVAATSLSTAGSDQRPHPTSAPVIPLGSASSQKQAAIAELKRSSDLTSTLSRVGCILHVQELNLILHHFGELRKWSEISQMFDWMQKHDLVNNASYSSFIKYMGKSKNPAKAVLIYNGIANRVLRMNVSICNSLLGCLLRNGKFENVLKLFDQMKEDGLKPDLVTYSTLLSGCSKVKNGYSIAMQLVQELKSQGLCMDSVIYGTLLSICASNKMCEEAEFFFQQMKAEGVSPNLFHYSSLLNAYSVNGDYVKADKLISNLKLEGLSPNKVVLTTLLKVYVRGGFYEKSRELLSELDALGYADEEMPYCLLMDGLAKAGQINEAKSIFHEMQMKNVKSNGYCFSIMISALCRSGLLNEAKQLATDFESRYDKYDLVMLNNLLRVYCNKGEIENVMRLLKKMDGLTITPDWNTFQILIKFFCREKLHHLAYRTTEDMHSKGYKLDEELSTSLIDQLAQSGAASEAFFVYNMLRYSKGTVHNSLHEKVLNILISGQLFKDAYVVMKDNAEHISDGALKKFGLSFVKFGNINMINDILKAFHRCGRKIDQKIFGAAVSRYITKPEKKVLLLQMLQWMAGHGYIVDPPMRNLLVENSHLFGKQLIEELLSKQHAMSRNQRNNREKI